MTALAFLKIGSRTLLLAGEGPSLRIYDHETRRLLLSEHIFKSQALHGICTRSTAKASGDENLSGNVLVWGGRSICLIAVESSSNHEGRNEICIRQIVRETQAEDWIFDACFSYVALKGSVLPSTSTKLVCTAVLVTAHNTLLSLYLPFSPINNAEVPPSLKCIAAGPRSVLYSAHVTCPRKGRGLVAAGTVFGEVILWSFPTNLFFVCPEIILPGHLHHTFTGHEGSVFGVRISKEAAISSVGFPKRILASCSDDRTIRIWNISDLGLDAIDNDVQVLSRRTVEHLGDLDHIQNSPCLATVMGHSSRIWGLRFLHRHKDSWDLISYGEDSTLQVWRMRNSSPTRNSGKTLISEALLLRHQSTYAFHSGKNIWAVAEIIEPDNEFLVSMGGADGRIVSCRVGTEDTPHHGNVWSRQNTIQGAYINAEAGAKYIKESPGRAGSAQKILFQGLEGKWLLRRNLKSAIPTYPSGLFEGTAVIEARDPTDESFDLEYLYSEKGELTTEQGFKMQATRQYVYRYQENANTISAWFVSTEDRWSVDYMFHSLEFGSTGRLDGKDSIVAMRAKGYHRCIEDDYQARYLFQMRDAVPTQWELTFAVQGPSKDYVAEASYVREQGFEPSITTTTCTNPSSQMIEAYTTENINSKTASLDTDSFKNYAWIDENNFITSTNYGNVLTGNLLSKANALRRGCDIGDDPPAVFWENVGKVNELNASCVIASTQWSNFALLGGSSGLIHMCQYSRQPYPVVKVSGKVTCLSAQKLPPSSRYLPQDESIAFGIAAFASCLNSSTAYILIMAIKIEDIDNSQNFLENSKTFEIIQNIPIDLPRIPHNLITTSSSFVIPQDVLILGVRCGCLAIYDILPNSRGLVTCGYVSSRIHGHGENAITTIQAVPSATAGDCSEKFSILTTSRDGTYSVHRVSVKRVEHETAHISLQTVHTCALPFGPNIEGATFVQPSKDLLLWGFRSKHFVVWNETRKTEVMTVECGGANRNWAYIPKKDGRGCGNFVWTKASICNVHSQAQASHEVLQHGGHGREIKAMAVSRRIAEEDGHTSMLIATGAEDTAIRIISYDQESTNTNKGFNCLGIFTNHKTGIQQLKWSSDGKYLFSAAAFEEFFIWRVRSVPCIGIGVLCKAQFPPVTESSDLRIMDFDILEIDSETNNLEGSAERHYVLSLVYSDSSMRVRCHCYNLFALFLLMQSDISLQSRR